VPIFKNMPESNLFSWSEMSEDCKAPALSIQTPPDSSEAGEQPEDVYSDFDEDEETEAPTSPTSTRKRRTRRRRRHGKNKASTSTASTASGGNSAGEDDGDGKTPAARGVVTWRDLGLGLGLNSKSAQRAPVSPISPSGRLAVARCEMAGQPLPMPPPPPSNPPDMMRDASERTVLPSPPYGRQQAGGHWFPHTDAGVGATQPHSGWGACWEQPSVSVPSSPWGIHGGAPSTPLANTPMAPADRFMAGFASVPCSPSAAATQSTVAQEVPSWLRGCDMPLGGEDLAQKLRAVAPETYED